MNFVKKTLKKEATRDRIKVLGRVRALKVVRALKEIGTLLLPISDIFTRL